jgi:glycosyltransferase involved in cell wall biosynthesis
MSAKKPSILFLTNGPIEYGPARLRIYQYEELWKNAGFEVSIINGQGISNSKSIPSGIEMADVVIISRFLDSKLINNLIASRKPIIFDYDDALFYVRSAQIQNAKRYYSIKEIILPLYRKIIRGGPFYSGQKRSLDRILRHAYAVTAGNSFLEEYAKQFNKNVHLLPTAVNISKDQWKVHSKHIPVVIGWIGVKDNFIHLEYIRNIFIELSKRFKNIILFKVVSSALFNVEGASILNKKWVLEEEIKDVNSFDIGIMPLKDDLFTQGKCAFKAVLCMAWGIPVVASNVGANRTAIKNGETGFLVNSTDDWVKYLSVLVRDIELRKKMGFAAREDMKRRYSVDVMFQKMLKLVEGLLYEGGR